MDLTTTQPAPVRRGDGPSMQSMVRADIATLFDTRTAGLMVGDVSTRERIGIDTYGTSLYPNNGRDALRDAYEELVDAALYLRQVLAEGNGQVHGLYVTVLRTAYDLRMQLIQRDDKR